MKYIKLKCNRYDCEAEFLIAMNDWYKEELGEEVLKYYICPLCEAMCYTDDDCVVELN